MQLQFQKEQKVKVYPLFENELYLKEAKQLKEKNLFSGKKKSIFYHLDLNGCGSILYGLGEKKEFNSNASIELFFHLSKKLKELNIFEFELILPKSIKEDLELINAALEGFLQNEYEFNQYKSEKDSFNEMTITLNEDNNEIKDNFKELKNLMEGVFITRDLVNIPSNDLYPETFANKIKDLFKDLNVKVEVYNKKQCEDLGMEALLQVARGSSKEPRLIVIKYLPLKEKEHLTFVGKGLMYDSGGYALKPAGSMKTMKSDMAGGGSVVGAIYALAKNNIQKNVVGVIGALENMVSGDSYKNGDIINSMKGTTIEVGNTDAEGRVSLADTLYYSATKLHSKAIVDLATLTGACIVALGEKVSGLVSNNQTLADQVLEASKYANEPLHQFEIFPTHREQVKGTIGDIKNSTKGGAGTITAGVFLEHFVEELPWAHLDIAGPAFYSSSDNYIPAGATGIPVKTIYYLAKNFEL